jgi:AAA+ superfamily predicted ATPase
MNIMIGDTIVTDDKQIGIVENRAGNFLTVRFPDCGNQRDQVPRRRARLLAKLICEARAAGKRLGFSAISLQGKSPLADLVSLFGYSTGQMRRESLQKVVNQLSRAGLEITSETDRWGRDDRFKISVPIESSRVGPDDASDDEGDGVAQMKQSSQPTTKVALPDPFWPTALGLDQRRELEFLRALTESDPILCLLFVPDEAQTHAWIQGTWEGLLGWAYRSAQRFCWLYGNSTEDARIRLGPAALLHTYLNPSVLDSDAPRLADRTHNLNLITIKRELELPTDFARSRAVWPGPIFEFRPDYRGEPSADIWLVNQCLLLAAGVIPSAGDHQPPLGLLNWVRSAYARLMATPVTGWGGVVASSKMTRFKGSNEGSTALALKAHLAGWVTRTFGNERLDFEASEDEDDEVGTEEREGPALPSIKRTDLFVKGVGCFEVESMRGSGPMESFYHRKIFSRVRKDGRFSLIVPNEAILWAGPYLSDLAHHLSEKNGFVMVPSAHGDFLEIVGRPLVAFPIDSVPLLGTVEVESKGKLIPEASITLKDVAGYQTVRRKIDEIIIWPERHGKLLRPVSRSSGVLFFGPPGCGKSRWARAIAGELEQEVRLLAPSDLRGPYIGWGQIMIREQFDWLAENDKRMLIIDEIDAVARSRRHSQMHSDDQACVNELLVQIDRVLGLGRLLVATTNFIGSMDDALMRSGRFGRFIPVLPPLLHESIEIVSYYLERLDFQSNRERAFKVRIPDKDRIEAIITPIYEQSLKEGRFYCGADLEEAVNSAYMRSARRALPDGGWSQQTAIEEVNVTDDELRMSLTNVPRSIQPDAVQQFRHDIGRYCDRETAGSISTFLDPLSVPCSGASVELLGSREALSWEGPALSR